MITSIADVSCTPIEPPLPKSHPPLQAQVSNTTNIRVPDIPAPRAANWSQCSLYPASNQRATSKLTAKPKNSKTFHPDEAP
ncbi:hypothetical protein TNCV_4706431 [Trichonephila clavipes]|nr:hypothetical protein TNCV_4706431 [Trichonephila clavipes]